VPPPPVPKLTGIALPSRADGIEAWNSPTPVLLTGHHFTPYGLVLVNGHNVPFRFVNSDHLKVVIPTQTHLHPVSIRVITPGGTSNAISLPVYAPVFPQVLPDSRVVALPAEHRICDTRVGNPSRLGPKGNICPAHGPVRHLFVHLPNTGPKVQGLVLNVTLIATRATRVTIDNTPIWVTAGIDPRMLTVPAGQMILQANHRIQVILDIEALIRTDSHGQKLRPIDPQIAGHITNSRPILNLAPRLGELRHHPSAALVWLVARPYRHFNSWVGSGDGSYLNLGPFNRRQGRASNLAVVPLAVALKEMRTVRLAYYVMAVYN